MSPLISPPSKTPHACVPPTEKHTYTLPMEVCADKVNPTCHVTHRPPAFGSTWDCPVCRAVWIVGRYQQVFQTGYRGGDGKEWQRASRWTARKHRRNLRRDGYAHD